MTESDVCDVEFSEADVLEAIARLKSGKSDAEGVCSEHVIMASSALANPLALFFTSLLRHGYISQCLRDCILIPLSKRNKDITCSQNYRPIALASTLSKILEHLICMKFAAFLSSSPLQFGFKAGSSTSICYTVILFLSSWYCSQQMKVRWDHSLSESFHVSNGVRQGGVLSPVLFAVYLDGLLEELADSGCGCYWRKFVCWSILLCR